MIASFDRFSLDIKKEDVLACSHQGDCEEDVNVVMRKPYLARQLKRIPAADIAAELKGYGAWDADQLADEYDNLARIVWIASGNIREEKRLS